MVLELPWFAHGTRDYVHFDPRWSRVAVKKRSAAGGEVINGNFLSLVGTLVVVQTVVDITCERVQVIYQNNPLGSLC